jgi:hypothetical protein
MTHVMCNPWQKTFTLVPLVLLITFPPLGDLKVIGTFHLSLAGELASYNQNFVFIKMFCIIHIVCNICI